MTNRRCLRSGGSALEDEARHAGLDDDAVARVELQEDPFAQPADMLDAATHGTTAELAQGGLHGNRMQGGWRTDDFRDHGPRRHGDPAAHGLNFGQFGHKTLRSAGMRCS